MIIQGLRPVIPKNTHPKLAELLEKCWQQDPASRPDFSEIIENLKQIAKEVRFWFAHDSLPMLRLFITVRQMTSFLLLFSFLGNFHFLRVYIHELISSNTFHHHDQYIANPINNRLTVIITRKQQVKKITVFL